MNSEIKFRGKRLDNGEWIYGDLIENQGRYFIYHAASETTMMDSDTSVVILAIGVIPRTVGQRTGVKGKNNQEIYEGDIVTAWSEGSRMVGVIKRRIDGLWIIYPAYQHSRFWHIAPNRYGVDDNIEIIGNIHDNPELLNYGAI